MPHELTPGAKSLQAFIDSNSLQLVDVVRELDVSRTLLYYWLSGAQRPGHALKEQIERWTKGKVKADSWFTKEELAEIKKTKPFEPTGTES